MKRVLITILFWGVTVIIMLTKTDKEQIETLYRVMYEAMVAKDTVTLNRVMNFLVACWAALLMVILSSQGSTFFLYLGKSAS